MSAKLMGEVWGLKLSHGKQVVLLALADHAHDDGTHCYPGVPYLAWKTGYSERNTTRLLGELEADGIIEAQDEKAGGYGNYTEYYIHLEKGDKKDIYKGDKSRKRVTSRAEKGDKSDNNPDNSAQKGDKSPRANIDEPSFNHQEPSVEGETPMDLETLPDDVTSACLLLLSRVKGFPRDQPENALYLAELRTEFPQVDARKTVREYQIWHRDNSGKTRNFRQRLRNFFERASRDASGSADTSEGSPPIAPQSTPSVAVEAIRTYDRDGEKDLQRFSSLAEVWDFTAAEEPPWKVLAKLGGTDEERKRNLTRLRSVARQAVKGAGAA